jgi:hypothetical protein
MIGRGADNLIAIAAGVRLPRRGDALRIEGVRRSVRKLMMAMCKMLLPTEEFDPRSMAVRVEDSGYTSSDTSPEKLILLPVSPVLCNRNCRLGSPLNASSRWRPISLLFSAFGTGIL